MTILPKWYLQRNEIFRYFINVGNTNMHARDIVHLPVNFWEKTLYLLDKKDTAISSFYRLSKKGNN